VGVDGVSGDVFEGEGEGANADGEEKIICVDVQTGDEVVVRVEEKEVLHEFR
jgi:hypothetical protein